MGIRVRNDTRNTLLVTTADIADTSAKRRRGLVPRERLEPGEGLWIVPCESAHTFFMKFAIDLIYLDKRKRVRKVRHAVACFGVPGGAFGIGTSRGIGGR